MERLFHEIPLERVSTSMTINAPAAWIFAFFLANAEKRGIPFAQLRGTLQNDILKEYIAQKEWIFPPEPHLRLITDLMAFCAEHVPQWNTISISGYHIREAGATAAQELAFTLADGFAYVEHASRRARSRRLRPAPLVLLQLPPRLLRGDRQVPRRAADLGAAHAGALPGEGPALLAVPLPRPDRRLQPDRPAAREQHRAHRVSRRWPACWAAASACTPTRMDEALALPTEKAVEIALRTQQIIAHEIGVANVIDPLGGSYYVEKLTDELEAEAEEYFRQIDELGGVVQAIEQGFFQREITRAAYEYQLALSRKRSPRRRQRVRQRGRTAGDPTAGDRRIRGAGPGRLAARGARRARPRGRPNGLEALKRAARGPENLIPRLLDCAGACASLGEISAALTEVFGEYREQPFF